MLKLYSPVKILSPKYGGEKLKVGDIGYIIEVYDNGKYEVEFSDSKTGEDVAILVLDEEEIELVKE